MTWHKRQNNEKRDSPYIGTSVECKVSCACGNEFVTKSTKDALRIDICNECHPFFTGSEKVVDTAGRIEKFKQRYAQK